MRKVSLNPEAMMAMQEAGGIVNPRPPLRLPRVSLKRIHMEMSRLMFGPTMKPGFRDRLLQFTSFNAILSSWAADHFLRKATAKRITEGLQP